MTAYRTPRELSLPSEPDIDPLDRALDRVIGTLAMPCSCCKARPGEPCRSSATGRPWQGYFHELRTRAAAKVAPIEVLERFMAEPVRGSTHYLLKEIIERRRKAQPARAPRRRPEWTRIARLEHLAAAPSSLATYRSEVERAAQWSGLEPAAWVARLAEGPDVAADLCWSYLAARQSQGAAPATVAKARAGCACVLRLLRQLGIVAWTIELPPVRVVPYRDTRGPSPAEYSMMLGRLRGLRGQWTSPQALRDLCALRLAWDLGLRRAEIARLDLADLEQGAEPWRLAVRGKGAGLEPRQLTLPGPTRAALALWLEQRGSDAGPLLCSVQNGGLIRPGLRRLDGSAIWRLVRRASARAGLQARPHGLRHGAITAALELSGGDVRRVRAFSRHADVRTVLLYDDARRDLGGEMAALVAAAVPGPAWAQAEEDQGSRQPYSRCQ